MAVIAIGISVLVGALAAVVGLGYFLFVTFKNPMNSDIKTKALDVFVYVGIAISLVVSVTNILQIVFTAINRKFPDVLNPSYYSDVYNTDVRMAIAMLVVMYPIYIGLSWYVARDISKFLYKRDLVIRKIFVYLTMFVTVCTLIGTLVSAIYTYLGGELSIRFIYKALAVFIVAVGVFGYYYYSLRRNYTQKTLVPAIATLLATITVIASLVWSISIIGTPSEMRAKRMDSTRLSDLSMIQSEVANHFQTTEKLPPTIEELDNAFQGYKVPVDPITGEKYTYKVLQQPVIKMNYVTNKKELTTDGVFEICSQFDTERLVDARGMDIDQKQIYSVSNYYYEYDQSPFWNHKAEYTCFKRVISSDMYYPR